MTVNKDTLIKSLRISAYIVLIGSFICHLAFWIFMKDYCYQVESGYDLPRMIIDTSSEIGFFVNLVVFSVDGITLLGSIISKALSSNSEKTIGIPNLIMPVIAITLFEIFITCIVNVAK